MPKPALPSVVHVLALVLAGWFNRHQQLAIEYLREENRVLREMLGTRRLEVRGRPAAPARDLEASSSGAGCSRVSPRS